LSPAKCTFSPGCNLDSPDRRVISHFFGRNKRETRAIPDECWGGYCRQHYQRARYRQSVDQFALTQMYLVHKTVENLEKWGGVLDWHIAVRKRAVDQIAREDGEAALSGKPITQSCRERAVVSFTGKHKTFADVYAMIDTVEKFIGDNLCEALEFEVVPQFHPDYLRQRALNNNRHPRLSQASASSSNVNSHSGSGTVAGSVVKTE